jgi:thiol-disulfide isomerase/thioredoxin
LQDDFVSAPPRRSARKKWLMRVVNLALIGAVVAFVARMHTFAAPHRLDVTGIAFERLDGSPMPPQMLQGRAVVLDFWAPWCPPCRAEMPWLDNLQKSDPGLLVLGVEDDPDEYGNGLDLARRKAITYPLVRSSQALHQKLGSISTLPTTLFISRSGRVVHAVTGALPEGVLRRFARDAQESR